jgi:hypothetical protein
MRVDRGQQGLVDQILEEYTMDPGCHLRAMGHYRALDLIL